MCYTIINMIGEDSMKRIIEYLVITFGFSWIAWGLQYLGQEGVTPEWTQIFGMFGVFGPFVAFLILVKRDGKSYKDTFKRLFDKSPLWTILFALISRRWAARAREDCGGWS